MNKGDVNRSGESAAKLANQIACIKYTLFCFNIIAWVSWERRHNAKWANLKSENLLVQLIGAALFAFTIWIRAEPGFGEWVEVLDIYSYYIGAYILIAAGALIMIFSFLGCCSALMEHSFALVLVSISSFMWRYIAKFSEIVADKRKWVFGKGTEGAILVGKKNSFQ